MPELPILSLYCSLQSRLQHIYHGQPYAKVDFIPQSGTLDLASDEEAEELKQRLLYLWLLGPFFSPHLIWRSDVEAGQLIQTTLHSLLISL
jgi:hypothetical protein